MSMNIGAKDIALLFCLGFCFGSAPASAKTPETTVFSATPVAGIHFSTDLCCTTMPHSMFCLTGKLTPEQTNPNRFELFLKAAVAPAGEFCI